MAVWKLKAGKHFEKSLRLDKDGKVELVDGRPVTDRVVEVEAGGTFESENDFSSDPEKFELVSGKPGKGRPQPVGFDRGERVKAGPTSPQFTPTPQEIAYKANPAAPRTEPTASDEELDGMTVAELKELAENEEIDLSGASRKDDILAAIRLAREGK